MDPALTTQIASLQTDLDKLDRAIASGVLTVESHTQGRVTYRDMAGMQAARSFLVSKIAGLTNPTAPQTRRVVLTGRSGF